MKKTLTLTRFAVRTLVQARRRITRLRKNPVEVAAALALTGFIACSGADTGADSGVVTATPVAQPAAHDDGVLGAATRFLQDQPALERFSFAVDGFHALKDNPAKQMEAHLSCNTVDADLTQCIVFDRAGADARLVGVEYVISAKAFAKLPPGERELWHPHNYEVLSGNLVAPGLPAALEEQVVEGWVNSWGKSWRLWDSGSLGHPKDALPLGEPELAWSFNADGEINPQLVADRDRRLQIDTRERRDDRRHLVAKAKPQTGVDALADMFPLRRPVDGVRPTADESARVVVDNWSASSSAQQQQQRQ